MFTLLQQKLFGVFLFRSFSVAARPDSYRVVVAYPHSSSSGAHLAPRARRRLAAVLLGWPYFQSSYSLLTHCILSPNNLVRMKAPNYSVLWYSSGKSISSLAPGAVRRHAAVLETKPASCRTQNGPTEEKLNRLNRPKPGSSLR